MAALFCMPTSEKVEFLSVEWVLVIPSAVQWYLVDVLFCSLLWKPAHFHVVIYRLNIYFLSFLLRSLDLFFHWVVCYSGLLKNSFYILDDNPPLSICIGRMLTMPALTMYCLFVRQRFKNWSPATLQFFHSYIMLLEMCRKSLSNSTASTFSFLPLASLQLSSVHCGLWFSLCNFWTLWGIYEGLKTYSCP